MRIRLYASNFEIIKCSKSRRSIRRDKKTKQFFCICWLLYSVRGIELNLWMHKNGMWQKHNTATTTSRKREKIRGKIEHLFLLLNFDCVVFRMALKYKYCFQWN